MPALTVTLLGGSPLVKARLAEQLRGCDQTIQIFTPQAADAAGKEGLTFLLRVNDPHVDNADAERLLRSDLDRRGICYQVLYGTLDECLTQASQVIQSELAHQTDSSGSKREVPANQSEVGNSRWIWTCDKCSDPACEHQLLTGLLAGRENRITELLP